MAGRFMKIKRIVIPFMTLVILTSQLAGCATLNSQEMLEEVQNTPEVILEYPELDINQSQSQDDIQVGDQQYTTNPENDEDDPSIGLVTSQDTEKQELSGAELIRYFQLTYDSCSILDFDTFEELINFELEMLVSFCEIDGEKLPADYATQYKNWRPVDEQQTPEVTLTFTEVNEQVWATSTVNIRSSPSTSDSNNKVGSLSKGQSVTRTGIGTGDYSDWSRVQLSDGSIVYIASSYLTTTKPSTSSNNNNGGSNTTPDSQTGQPAQPSSGSNGSYDPDTALWTDPYAGMTPEEKEAQIRADQEATQKIVDGDTGTLG